MSKDILRLPIQATANKIVQENGRYPTCITSKTKLIETKPIKVIYKAINSKLTESTRNRSNASYNINVIVAMLY